MIKRKIKHFTKILSLLFISMTFTVPLFASGEILVLTLEDALELAMEKNDDIRISKEETHLAEAQIREAWSGALPYVTVDNLYNRNLTLPAFFLTFDDKITKITVGSKNSYQSQATIAQPLWLGGKVGNALRIAKIYRNASEEALVTTKNEIQYRVKEHFYGILLAREAIFVARQTLEQNEAHYREVKKKFEHGVVSEFDLLRADVRAANSRPPVIQTENRLELLYTSLRNILGVDPDQKIQMKGEFKYVPLGEAEIETGNREALSLRPELKELDMTSQMLELNIKLERANWYPSLYFIGAMQFMGQSNDFRLRTNQRNISYNVGFHLQFPIFDGFRTSARVEQAEVKYQKSLYQIDKFKDGIRTETKQAVLQMKEANLRVKSLIRNLEQAEKAYNIAVVRYNNGVGTQLELFDAQLARDMANINYLEGIYDYLMAQAAWEKAVGR